MKIWNINKIVFCLWLVTAYLPPIGAQETFIIAEGSKIWVDGTSTLRNWKADVQKFSGKLTTGAAGEISAIELTMDVKSMEGGRGPDMNTKIFNALKSDQFPAITFSSNKISLGEGGVTTAEGALSVAGQSKTIQVVAAGSVLLRKLTGQYKLKFSDFSIEPPSAMFGQIVCHDEMTIQFELLLAKQP